MMNLKTNSWPIHSEEELAAVNNVLMSGCTNYWTGTEGREFEKEFAQFIGANHAIALMNGTVALEAALYALDIGPGDEVITTCRTFIASASSIIMRGGTPVFAEVDINSQNITAETIEPCITPRTKAIIVVHLAGWPADLPAILALAKKYNLKVIEDCAQAHGAMIENRYVGTWGDIAAFSFCQDKIITTGGEGGMITTNDEVLWKKMWSYKDHGKNYDKIYHAKHPPGFRWLHDSFGTNWRMTEMQAAIGRVQLKKLPTWLTIRRNNAESLNKAFANVPSLRLTLPPSNVQHVYYKYYVFLRPEFLKADWTRNRIMAEMLALNIPCFVGSCCRIYLEKAFVSQNLTPTISQPIADQLGETSLMFLVHPTLTQEDMQKTSQALINILDNAVINTR